ncbi:Uncharacterized protein FWK35_00016826 [Aphis craccivora]|uniref:Uncharacterized protein n=1 Tax=Aphis craccivora TaxID=307492 RepID=A0A6G0ZKE4_APHCR|nr:Uncharacterized protein FWK35_00016826 [Aphis craccivora]
MNSERSGERIDFTMIISCRNNASISKFGGGFRWQSEYPWCIIEVKIWLTIIIKELKIWCNQAIKT